MDHQQSPDKPQLFKKSPNDTINNEPFSQRAQVGSTATSVKYYLQNNAQ